MAIVPDTTHVYKQNECGKELRIVRFASAHSTVLYLVTEFTMSEKTKALQVTEKQEHESIPSSYSTSGITPSTTFEDYLHYAAIQRQAEENDGTSHAPKGWFYRLSDHKGPNVNVGVREASDMDESTMTADEIEKMNASRALRLVSWASVFYLLTTDVLGPFNAPFAISQVGWVPGIILYFFMGLIALYTGLLLWRLHIRLDSLRYPIKSYSDIVERIYGRTARRVSIFIQGLQLIVNVGLICLSNAQGLSQITRGHLCFSVCVVIWALVGMVIGQIRTLKNYGWLANSAVWINLLIIFISMGFIAHSPPNFAAALRSLGVPEGPVVTHAFTSLPLFSQVNGIMNMVFAYGGAMIFPEIMAEMRRPMDFWKGMAMGQALIFSAYLLYGAFVYAFQGQFTLPLAYQGVSKYGWQTVGNVMSLISGIIAAGLYGNIGLKTIYSSVVEEILNGPQLMSRKGRYLWSIMVCLYWALAYIIASAIPQVQTINGLIAAIAIMQFSYTFPPLLRLGYDVITDAMSADREYVPGRGTGGRADTWSQWSRWKRGLFSGRWYFKLFNLIIGLGGLAMACLGMWGAGKSIKATFDLAGAATSFGCRSPV